MSTFEDDIKQAVARGSAEPASTAELEGAVGDVRLWQMLATLTESIADRFEDQERRIRYLEQTAIREPEPS